MDRIAFGLGLQIGLWRVGAGVVACRAYIFHSINGVSWCFGFPTNIILFCWLQITLRGRKMDQIWSEITSFLKLMDGAL